MLALSACSRVAQQSRPQVYATLARALAAAPSPNVAPCPTWSLGLDTSASRLFSTTFQVGGASKSSTYLATPGRGNGVILPAGVQPVLSAALSTAANTPQVCLHSCFFPGYIDVPVKNPAQHSDLLHMDASPEQGLCQGSQKRMYGPPFGPTLHMSTGAMGSNSGSMRFFRGSSLIIKLSYLNAFGSASLPPIILQH